MLTFYATATNKNILSNSHIRGSQLLSIISKKPLFNIQWLRYIKVFRNVLSANKLSVLGSTLLMQISCTRLAYKCFPN